jgi:5-methyltetrahydropteroyltriglutamate--homocysteine methyltransferase
MTESAIREQADAGLDVLTDGQIRWNDPISHLLRGTPGVEINGLIRFYDTNFYYRRPIIKAEPKWTRPVLADEFAFARKASPKPIRAVIVGPFTLAGLSHNRSKLSADELRSALARFVAKEVQALAKAGAEQISIEEPEILRAPKEIGRLGKLLEPIVSAKGKAKLTVTTYFGDAAPVWAGLQDLPVDGLGLDLTYSKKLPDLIRAGSSKALVLGVVDARNTRLESPQEIARIVERVKAQAALAPSCSLEYLPRDRALEKLGLLSRALRLLSGKK